MKDFMNWFNPAGQKGESGESWGDHFPHGIMDMQKMNDYVQKSIEEALSPAQHMMSPSHSEKNVPSEYKVIELMSEVIVKINVPDEAVLESIRLTTGNGKLFVEGVFPERLTISLPAQTSRRNTYAKYHEGVIEIHLPKKRSDEKEIFLHY